MDERDRKIAELEKKTRSLEAELVVRDALISALSKQVGADATKIQLLKEALRKQYESSTEQLMLFDEAETTSALGALEESPDDGELKVRSYIRRKASRSSVALPSDTPVVDIQDDSSIGECPRCGSRMEECGEKVYETFTRVSYSIVVRRHVKQYTCTMCTPESPEEGRIVETPATASMLDGTICDPTLLADIAYSKYGLAMPLYRQQDSYRDIGLTRFTMSSWLMKVGTRIAEGMAPALEREIYSHPLVNMDETPVEVLGLKGEDGKRKAPNSRSNAFMVVRAAVGRDGRNGPVLFTYSDNRRDETIYELVKPYHGALQTDGLAGYDHAHRSGGTSFEHLGCWVHSRRKCVEACGKSTTGPAYELLQKYAEFFHEEGLFRDANDPLDESYCERRREKLLPLLEDIRDFCREHIGKAMPKSHFFTACDYPLQRWDSLVAFLDHPYATSSNQRAENAIRPFCVGKRNWLFTITELGASVSAIFYSLIESCRSMDIDARDYLAWLFMNANGLEPDDIDGWTAMLPGKADISSMKDYRQMLHSAKPDQERTEPYILRGKRV